MKKSRAIMVDDEADEIFAQISKRKDHAMATHNIEGVEVFSAGTWNGDPYTVDDLDAMVEAHKAMPKFMPPLKLGHSEKQALVQADGMPAAGYIGKLYRKGTKLLADFVDIPDKVFQLLKNKAYRKVSSEICWNADVNGTKYKRLLCGVALLGADMPAVTNLSDIMSMYGMEAAGDAQLKIYELEAHTATEENSMDEKVKELEAKVADHETALKAKDAELAAKEAEAADLRKFKAEAEAKAADDQKKAAFAAELAKVEKISPAEKPLVELLIGEEKKEYAFGEKTLSKGEVLNELLKLHATNATVNKTENTVEGDKPATDEVAARDEEIKAYMAEHKVRYGDAYRAVERKHTTVKDEETDEE